MALTFLKSFRISNIISFILFVVFAITPLIEAQNRQGYEHPKVQFFVYSAVLTLILFVVYPKQIKISVFSKSRVAVYGLLFIVSVALLSFFRSQFPASILGFYPYFQGIILYILLFLFAFLVSSMPISLKKYCYVIAASACIVALIAIKQWVSLHVLGMNIATYSGRVVSTFGQPNLYSGYLVMVLPLVFLLLESASWRTQGKKKMLFLAAIGVIILGVVVSMSRLSLAMLVAMGIVTAIFYLSKSRYFKKGLVGIVVILILFASMTLPTLVQKEVIDPLTGSSYIKNEPDKRIFIWQVAVIQGIKQPLFGYGIDSFSDVYKSYFADAARDDSYYGRRDLVVDRAHNYVLDLFVYFGMIGLTLWIFLVKNMFTALRKQRFLMLSLLLYLIFVLFHPQSVAHLIYFWFLVGFSTKPHNDIISS